MVATLTTSLTQPLFIEARKVGRIGGVSMFPLFAIFRLDFETVLTVLCFLLFSSFILLRNLSYRRSKYSTIFLRKIPRLFVQTSIKFLDWVV